MSPAQPMFLAGAAALSVFIAALVAFQAFVMVREWRVRKLALGSLRGEVAPSSSMDDQNALFRRGILGDAGIVRNLAERIPQLWDLQHLLVQSGLDWTLSGFITRKAVWAVVFGVIVTLAADSGLFTAVAMVVGWCAPYVYARRKKTKRLRKLESQLPDAIDSLARAVRAGHPLSDALRMASEETPKPLGEEFRTAVEEQRFGLPFEDALMGFGDRIEIMDVRILVTAILVQKEVGGNLTEILEQIAETMRARFNLRRQVRVYTAQGRMSGYTLAALPVLVGLMISLINPPYLRMLFVEPLGQVMLTGAIALQGFGFLWIRKIVDIRY